MEDWAPFSVTCWSKAYQRRGPVAGVNSLTGAIRRNAPGDCQITVDSDHPRVNDLAEPGARVVVTYQPTTRAQPRTLISGVVEERDGTSGPEGGRTFQVTDDWADIFNETQGWPVPTKAISQQGDESMFFTRTGPAETVLKDIVRPNVVREQKPLTIPASQGLGQSIKVATRFDVLADKLFPAVERAGLLVRVVQVGAERRLLVTAPTVRTRVLDEASGVIAPGGTFSRMPPAKTRVVVSTGSGEGVTRAFREYVNTSAETLWGFRRTGFLEVSGEDGDLESLMQQQGQEFLAENGERTSLSLEMAETDHWRYGVQFELGDQISVRPTGASVLTDWVREVEFAWEPEGGPLIVPKVGDWDQSADAYTNRVVAQLSRRLRIVERNR